MTVVVRDVVKVSMGSRLNFAMLSAAYIILKSQMKYEWCPVCSFLEITHDQFSRDMRFPTLWYVRPAKPQISLRIRAVWSEPLLVVWILYDCLATDRTSFGVSKLKRRLHRLVWVYTCQNDTLLEITCQGSIYDTCCSIWRKSRC